MEKRFWFWVLWFLPDGRECAVRVAASSRTEAESSLPPVEGSTRYATWLDSCHAGVPGARFGLRPGSSRYVDVV